MGKTKIGKNKLAQINALVKESAPKAVELKYSINEEDLIVKVNPVLPFSKRMQMVKEIVDSVFMGEMDSVHTYAPEVLSFIKKHSVIKYYTDLALPEKIDDAWLVLNYTSIYGDVVNVIGAEEINDIFNAADKSIDTYRRYLAAKTDTNAFMNKIANLFTGIGSNESIDDLLKMFTGQADTNISDIIQGVVNAQQKPNTINPLI